MDGGLFGKQQVRPVQRQVAVYFIGGYLMEPGNAVLAAGIHQRGCADDVCLQENAGVINTAVHMGFRGEIDNHFRMLFLKQGENGFPVADVRPDKAETGIVHNRFQGGQVSRIGELVQADNPVFRILVQQVKDIVGTDEAGAAGNDGGHGNSSGNGWLIHKETGCQYLTLPSATAFRCAP